MAYDINKANRERFLGALQAAQDGSDTRLNLNATPRSDAEFAEIIAALKNSPTLEDFMFGNAQLTDEHIKQLAPLLGKLPKLKSLGLDQNNITDEGLEILCQHLAGHPSLEALYLNRNNLFTAEGMRHVTPLFALPKLASLYLAKDGPTHDIYGKAICKAAAGAYPFGTNLVELDIWSDKTPIGVKNNRKVLSDIKEKLYGTSKEEWDVTVKNLIYWYTHQTALEAILSEEWSALQEDTKATALFNNLQTIWSSLPVAGDDVPTLGVPDENGFTVFDNPLFWENFAATSDCFAKQDTPIPKTLLMQTNRDGDPRIRSGIVCRQTDAILAHLNAHGEYFTPDDLLDGKEPNVLLNAIIEHDDVNKLFTLDNWRGQGANAMLRVYRALPDLAKEHVAGIQTLTARLSRSPTTLPQEKTI